MHHVHRLNVIFFFALKWQVGLQQHVSQMHVFSTFILYSVVILLQPHHHGLEMLGRSNEWLLLYHLQRLVITFNVHMMTTEHVLDEALQREYNR